MNPADVPAELVEKVRPILAELLATEGVFVQADHPRFDHVGRRILAAVLPEVRAQAKVEAVTEARKVISQYLATAEKWRYDRVMWAFAIMLGEIPEDTPCPGAAEQAARIREGRGA